MSKNQYTYNQQIPQKPMQGEDDADVADADALCSIEIQISKNNPRYRRWFTTALVVEVVACLEWNWFKL